MCIGILLTRNVYVTYGSRRSIIVSRKPEPVFRDQSVITLSGCHKFDLNCGSDKWRATYAPEPRLLPFGFRHHQKRRKKRKNKIGDGVLTLSAVKTKWSSNFFNSLGEKVTPLPLSTLTIKIKIEMKMMEKKNYKFDRSWVLVVPENYVFRNCGELIKWHKIETLDWRIEGEKNFLLSKRWKVLIEWIESWTEHVYNSFLDDLGIQCKRGESSSRYKKLWLSTKDCYEEKWLVPREQL